MIRHAFRHARVIVGTVAICLVMLAGLAMPLAVSAEQLGNQGGSSEGQRFCTLVGGTVIAADTILEGGGNQQIKCLLADGRTILDCTITARWSPNICSVKS